MIVNKDKYEICESGKEIQSDVNYLKQNKPKTSLQQYTKGFSNCAPCKEQTSLTTCVIQEFTNLKPLQARYCTNSRR